MDKLKVCELRAYAKERGLKGFSKMKKEDLIIMLSNEPVQYLSLGQQQPIRGVSNEVLKKGSLKNQVVDIGKKSVNWLWNAMKDTTNRMINRTTDKMKDGWNAIKGTAQSIKNSVLNKIENIWSCDTVNNKPKERHHDENLYWKINELSEEADYDDIERKVLSARNKYGEERYSKYLAMYFHNQIKTLEDVKLKLISVYKKENNAFKFHLAFGYVTEKTVDENSRVYLYKPGRQYFNDEPTIIKNKKDMEDFASGINRETIVHKIATSFPDTSTRLLGVYSMAVKVIKLDYPVGTSIELPDYIENSNNIIGLKDVANNLCFWACIALADGCRRERYITKAKQLFNKFYKNKRKIEEYKGFDYVKELDKFEKINKKHAINIVSYDEDESIEYVRKSDYNSLRTPIYINLYMNHFSFIPNLEKLAKMYICNRCGAKCRDNSNLMRHIEKCTLKQQDTFEKCPKVYEKKRNEIVELCDYFDEDDSIFTHDYMITFDEESMLHKVNETRTKLKFDQKHVPISVSIATNVPGFEEPHFILSREPETIVVQMFEHFDKIAEKSRELMLNKMTELIEKVNEHYNEKEKTRFLNTIDRYCSNIPIVGFNSSFYDINLLMNYGFMKEIKKREPKLTECELDKTEDDQKPNAKKQDESAFILKNGTRYTVIKTNTFTFLDQMNYCAAGTDLRSFIKAHDVGQQKSHFPYEWLDCYSKLDCLIADLKISDFDSSLKKTQISQDDFNQLMQTCEEENLIYIKDLLKWYNNLDVTPLLRACLKSKEHFYRFKLDMYKDAFTLPGLSENILFQFAQDGFDEYLKQESPANVSHRFVPTNIDKKLKNYKKQDTKVNRALDDFIEKHEIMKLFKKQKYVCYYCWCLLTKNEKKVKNRKNTNWTLDRIDCSKAHLSGNCVISCWDCNHKRSDTIMKKFYRKKALLRFAETKPMIYVIDKANKEVFYKLKENIVGGPSIVYHRYHEVGATKINRLHYDQRNKKWFYGNQSFIASSLRFLRCLLPSFISKFNTPRFLRYFMNTLFGKDVKKIVGYDANALYLYALGLDQLCGVLKYVPTTEEDLVERELSDEQKKMQTKLDKLSTSSEWLTFLDTFFGLVEIDIEIPQEKYEYFGEMPPIFKNIEYSEEEGGEYMKKIINDIRGPKFTTSRKLIASLKAKKVLINSTRLKWLLEKGAIVTKVYGVIATQRGKPFEGFVGWVSDERRKGDKDTCYAIIAEAAKLVGNSAYGRTGMNKNKFKNTKLCDEKQFNRAKNNFFFYDAEEHDDGNIYEVTSRKRTVKQNMPIQIAFNVLDDAKFKMTTFYYDCVDKYIDRSDYQYMYMDTDSAYMALAGDFENLIKPEMMQQFEIDKDNWFPRTDTEENKAFDKRKPGLFKTEWTGNWMTALSSKTYFCRGTEGHKLSCKGAQKARNKQLLNEDAFNRSLNKNEVISCQNKGFRFIDKVIKTYEQNKIALTPIYVKGVVMDDGLHVRPLDL
jgi:hypothetical protein